MKIKIENIEKFDIQKKIAQSNDFNEFISNKKDRGSTFNLKSYLKALHVKNGRVTSKFMDNFVVPDHKLPLKEKLTQISRSKAINDKILKSKEKRENEFLRAG